MVKFERLDGTNLRIAVEEWIPHVEVISMTNGSISASGPMALLLDLLSSSLNFNYTLHRPPDGLWGAPDDNGNWNGMIGMVRRNEVDIALGPFIISETRASAVQFSSIFLIDYFRMMFARELPKADPWSFVRTFTPSVWIGVGICLILTTIPLAISRYFIENQRQSRYRTLETTFFSVIGLFLQQDLSKDSKVLSIRIVLFCVYVLNIVILKNFSSTLTSLLAIKVSPIKFNFFQDVVDDTSYTMALEASTAITAALKKSEIGLFGELNKKLKDKGLIEVKIGELYDFTLTKVKEEKYALFVEEITCKKYTSDSFTSSGICEFYLADEKVLPSQFGIIGQINSSFLSSMNPVLQAMVESDLYNLWLGKMLPNQTTCLDKSSFIHLSMESYSVHGLRIMFTLLCYGLLFATFVLFCEKFIFKYKNNSNPRSLNTSRKSKLFVNVSKVVRDFATIRRY